MCETFGPCLLKTNTLSNVLPSSRFRIVLSINKQYDMPSSNLQRSYYNSAAWTHLTHYDYDNDNPDTPRYLSGFHAPSVTLTRGRITDPTYRLEGEKYITAGSGHGFRDTLYALRINYALSFVKQSLSTLHMVNIQDDHGAYE